MKNIEKFLDNCEICESRKLEFVFIDFIKRDAKGNRYIKDIPGFRCQYCGQILLSTGALESIDPLFGGNEICSYFPYLDYQDYVTALSGDDRKLTERLLHSWELIQCDGRSEWDVWGHRCLVDWANEVSV